MEVFGKERDYIVHDDKVVKGFFGPFRFLSNYAECDVWFEGLKYSSTEAAYQAAKTDVEFIREKYSTVTASQSKKMAKKIPVRENWDNIKYDVMSSIIFEKFFRNPELRKQLLETGDKVLEETNHWKDVYWGVCDGKGESKLGEILMSIRSFWQAKEKGTDKITKVIL